MYSRILLFSAVWFGISQFLAISAFWFLSGAIRLSSSDFGRYSNETLYQE